MLKTAAVTMLGALALGAVWSTAAADVLLMESVHNAPANSPQGVQRPSRGMTMDAVEQRFGAPAERAGPVGEPPISRWVYDRYTVYFEHDRVLHTVVKRDPAR